ncbi:MAG: glucuronate isomerase [Anaerolineaceae bacterium]|nr:glucuronate isomerase [Anaerolineaceae bacterium]MCB9102190.1 glucuronate isomerase [Anaerolineales bacterium]
MSKKKKIFLPKDRYFGPTGGRKKMALILYQKIADLPLVCPHGHVDPRLFADPDYRFGNPAELLIVPDHYIFRMLYSQGVALEDLGIPRRDGGPVETDPRQIWQRFADHFHLFRGTPTGLWLVNELHDVFGVDIKLTGDSAQDVYDQVAAKLAQDDFTPRALFKRFKIEVLCTTDAATDPLAHHQAIRRSGWAGRILPTFRPDAVVNIDTVGWGDNIAALSEVSGVAIDGYGTFIQALENRRAFFKSMGATATDHAALTPYTAELSPQAADAIFQRALRGEAAAADAAQFTGHMLLEMARMSIEDGLVMQLHPGSRRDHNHSLFERFGRDMGADIPQATEYTHNLRPLLNKYGTDSRLTLVLFTLDETTYSRELAPLAGHYPALRLGPPWWFFDSWNGMEHYFNQVIETAGLYNTAGFNDDTRAYPSIPARHDMWRRAAVNWLADLVVRGMLDEEDAVEMATELAYGLAKRTYKL